MPDIIHEIRRNSWAVVAASALLISSCATQANLMDLEVEQERLRFQQTQLQEKLAAIEKLSETGSTSGQRSQTDVLIRMDQLAAELQALQGRVEESSYLTSEMSQRIDDSSFRTKELTDRLDILDRQIMLLEESVGRTSKSGVSKEPGGTPESPARESKPSEGNSIVLPGKAAGALSPSEAYGLAYNDYLKGNYELALNGFQNFLVQYKDTSLAPNAQYWIGESYYGQTEYKKAIEAFQKVVKEYPSSSKVPGAILKTGYAYIQLADREKAREVLKKVVQDYPLSDEANLAKSRLAELN